MGDADEIRDLLRDRPELESALELVLQQDADAETWGFDDVGVDSGSFGELVSRDLVEKTDDGEYRLADPGAVRAALSDEAASDADRSVLSHGASLSLDVRFDRRAVAALCGLLGLLVAFRFVSLPAVYRDEHVVLSGNDPYFYRYWIDKLLAEAAHPLDFSVLPDEVLHGEPLMVGVLWWATSILGGTRETAGHVLAVYPVAMALLTGVLVYALAVRVTDDKRVGLAAVAVLAVVPAHAMRTSLGFADHHAFDYSWLVLTALSVVALGQRTITRESWRSRTVVAASAGLAVGVAGQILAWEAAPLLVFPLAGFLALSTLLDVAADRSPAVQTFPYLAGIAVAAVVTHVVHTTLGWHTAVVAYAPALLFGGVVGLLVVAETVHRLDLPVAALGGVQAVLVVVGPLAFRAVLPTFWTRLAEELGRLFGRFGDARIAETQSLFGADSFGWLLLFGFTLVLALPYVAWASREAYRGSKPWLAASVYGWYFLVLAGIQLRFAGELSPFVALFAGLGFVHIAERIDLARKPVPLRTETGRPADGDASRSIPLPDRRTLGGLAVLFLLVGGLGMLQIPVKTSQLQYSDSEYRAAVWTAEYTDAEGMTYPENYVLSSWGDNRMYNYFVNGEARFYNYARENYTPFINSTDASGWGDRFVGRVGFVVTEDISAPPETIQARLHRAYGSRSSGGPGLAHYRAVFVTDDGSRKVFEVVPGATVSGTVTGGPTTIATTVELDGTSFTYERRIEPDANGRFNVTVPYPGTYEVGNRTVEVPETSVRSGGRVTVGG